MAHPSIEVGEQRFVNMLVSKMLKRRVEERGMLAAVKIEHSAFTVQ